MNHGLTLRRSSLAIPATPEPNSAMLLGSGTLIPVTNPVLSVVDTGGGRCGSDDVGAADHRTVVIGFHVAVGGAS